jgi:hypothetical protein
MPLYKFKMGKKVPFMPLSFFKRGIMVSFMPLYKFKMGKKVPFMASYKRRWHKGNHLTPLDFNVDIS